MTKEAKLAIQDCVAIARLLQRQYDDSTIYVSQRAEGCRAVADEITKTFPEAFNTNE